MRKEISTVIIGGSYFAIGYASAHADCMVLESSQILGIDFHRGLRTADLADVRAKEADTELGKLFADHQVWQDGKFDILKAAPVLHAYCNQNNLKVTLDARLLAAEKESKGYMVRYITNSGIHEIRCTHLLDTTVLRDTYREGIYCKKKTLNLFTVCVEDGFEEKLKAAVPDCRIEEGMNPGERVVKIPFPTDKKISRAYEAVTEIWKKAFPGGEEKILFIAQDFDYSCSSFRKENAPCPWVGAMFSDPLSAFAAGRGYEL